jgi:hypothetical protein
MPLAFLSAALLAQDAAPPPDWGRDFALAREAYARLNYAEAADRARAAVEAASGEGKLEALRLLAGIRRAQGSYAEAAESLARAAEVCAAVHGAQGREAAGILSEISALERVQGRTEAALETLNKAIVIREAAPGGRPEDLARDLTAAGSLEIKLAREELAARDLARAVELWNAASPGDVQVLPALEALANLYRNQSKYAEAEPLLVRALKLRESATGPDGPEVIALIDSLAYCYFGVKRWPEAEAHYKRLLDLWEKTAGLDHPMRALTLDKMAEFYAFQQRYEEGEKAAAEALAMRARMHAASLSQTGRLILMQARLEQAEDHYRRAIEIGDLAKIPDDAMDPLLRVYAQVLRGQKKLELAQAVEQRVKEALLRKADREGRRPPPGRK